ncbi:unnamed protein product [Adineta ricciae]|uniref:Uncharacterized protein n=1 Tax=Adineta ricciae TaxID=249248 RepID=A0A814D972_ADIRI|nr:unnamed protein product [Adineta ricciae]
MPISYNLALSNLAESYAGRKAGLSVYDRNILYNDFDYLNNSTLTFEKRIYSTNIQVLYRLPKKVPIFALLLIFHGCSRSANDWFTTIERQRIVGAAVDLGYGCLAFQSTDQLSRCWSSESELAQNPDIQMVWNGLAEFYKEHPTLKSLPRFTFGASSGGIFSSVFATNSRDKIQGQIIFISIVLPDVLETHVKQGNYPPTAWIYMARDMEFASEARINESMKIFAEHNIPHISFAITPIPITATIFHERIPTITKETSEHIAYLLRNNNWIDGDTYLRYNPRRRNTWRDFISLTSNKTITNAIILDNINTHQNILPDFFNTLYGEHEISFERSFEALQWHHRISKSKQNSTS